MSRPATRLLPFLSMVGLWIGGASLGAQQASPLPSPAAVIPDIVKLIGPQAEAELFSGMVVVTQGDSIIFEQAYGFADWENRVPVSEETRFGIGSITKAMTQILARKLAATERLDLDAPVERYLNAFPRGPRGGAPSVRHLLEHRGGVPHRVTQPVEESQALGPSAIVERVRDVELLFEPGAERLYSSAGYTVLARVIEVVEGRAFDAVLRERVFDPAGMTGATGETGQSLMPYRAHPFRLGSDGRAVAVKRASHKDLQFLTGAGSVYATASDLVRFGRAVQEGVFGQALTESVFGGDPETWRGWYGRTSGYEASLDLLPSADLVVVMLTNLRSAANWQLRAGIQELLTGASVAPVPLPPDVVASFENPESVVGRFGPAEITLVDGHLFRGENELYPIAGERYYTADSGTVLRFRRDSAGNVDALISIPGSGDESVLPRSGG